MARYNNLKTIHHWSAGYELVRIIVEFFFRSFYKRFESRNKANVPKDVPVILAPNHQNALMDALAILMTLHGQPVFLARADMFKKKVFARILHFFNIMPVFRMRDGVENLSQNDEIFDAALTILHDKHQLCLMPEGNHGDKRKLRPLVKGIFRIAFMAQKEKGAIPFVKIVPVGIDYSNYSKFRQNLFVNFGKPIDVSEYFAQWEVSPAVSMNALRDRLSAEMSLIMIDIRSEKYYEEVLFLRTIYNDEMLRRMKLKKGRLGNEHDADREMIRCIQCFEEEQQVKMEELASNIAEYRKMLEKHNLRDWVVKLSDFSYTGIFLNRLFQKLFFLIFLYGFINNALPYFIAARVAKKIKDIQFQSSVKMGLGMIVFIIQFIVLAILVFSFFSWYFAIAYLISIPVSGWITFNYYIWWKKTLAKLRFHSMPGGPGSDKFKLTELRNSIISTMNDITEKYSKFRIL